MATKKYIPTQREKVRGALPFSAIVKRDTMNRPRVTITPGTNGKQYQQIIRRNGAITVECTQVTDLGTVCDCKGNEHSVCYHTMIALTLAARDAGKKLTFCYDAQAAERLSRLGGEIIVAYSHQSKKAIWGVLR